MFCVKTLCTFIKHFYIKFNIHSFHVLLLTYKEELNIEILWSSYFYTTFYKKCIMKKDITLTADLSRN